MCGIAGVFADRVDVAAVARMAGAIAHRGPDDEGVWVDAEAGIGLGHRRLSIVDLGPGGHQPMASASGRLVLCFNGEIDNHGDLRRALDGEGGAPAAGWRGHSDTETLVEAIAHWGLEATLDRAVGMFAFALWDRGERVLRLVRDRFGEKPLYYGWAGRDFLFGSELKALRAWPGFEPVIDRRALDLFLRRTHVPAPFSIYRGVFKLPPGCILTLTPAGACTALSDPPLEGAVGAVSLRRYWSYPAIVQAGLDAPFQDRVEALRALDEALGRAVASQALADVPVGAFLSGGIDSSTVVALYQRHSARPIRTFSIGFEDAAYDESGAARAVAAALGTVHHEQIVTAADARDVIPLLPAMYDEPFADSSQIPTHLVSRFARGAVTVALTGDGGDELFGGYNRHRSAPRLWAALRRVPVPLRAVAGAALGRVPSRIWARGAGFLPGTQSPHIGGKLQKGLRVAGSARSLDDVYASFLDEWSLEPSVVLGLDGPAPARSPVLLAGAPGAVRLMTRDALGYLPDDVLCKVDRAAMAVGLETRVPFLDHRVAAVAARIPIDLKIGPAGGKLILRTLLARHLPPALFERPKAGFAVPVGAWLEGPLRPWAEELLDERRLAADGWLDPARVRRRWADHLSGRRDSTAAIWSLLMFQAWLEASRGA